MDTPVIAPPAALTGRPTVAPAKDPLGHNAYCWYGKHTVRREDSEQVLISGLSLRICKACLEERGL